MTDQELAALAERHHLRITIRGDGSIYGLGEDLKKLRVLLALKPLLKK